jgi:hypothetical protein
VLLVSISFFFLIKLYFSKILSPAGSCEDLVDNVVSVCFFDEEVDICWTELLLLHYYVGLSFFSSRPVKSMTSLGPLSVNLKIF